MRGFEDALAGVLEWPTFATDLPPIHSASESSLTTPGATGTAIETESSSTHNQTILGGPPPPISITAASEVTSGKTSAALVVQSTLPVLPSTTPSVPIPTTTLPLPPTTSSTETSVESAIASPTTTTPSTDTTTVSPSCSSTLSHPTVSPSATTSSSNNGISCGLITGISTVAGVIILVALLVLIIALLRRSKRRANHQSAERATDNESGGARHSGTDQSFGSNKPVNAFTESAVGWQGKPEMSDRTGVAKDEVSVPVHGRWSRPLFSLVGGSSKARQVVNFEMVSSKDH